MFNIINKSGTSIESFNLTLRDGNVLITKTKEDVAISDDIKIAIDNNELKGSTNMLVDFSVVYDNGKEQKIKSLNFNPTTLNLTITIYGNKKPIGVNTTSIRRENFGGSTKIDKNYILIKGIVEEWIAANPIEKSIVTKDYILKLLPEDLVKNEDLVNYLKSADLDELIDAKNFITSNDADTKISTESTRLAETFDSKVRTINSNVYNVNKRVDAVFKDLDVDIDNIDFSDF